jgi:hypothetical protein
MSGRDVSLEVVNAAKELLDAVQNAKRAVAFTEDGSGPFVGLIDRPQFQDTPGSILRPADRLREALLRWDLLA